MAPEMQILLNYGALGVVTYVLLRFTLKTLHRMLTNLSEQHERIIDQATQQGAALNEIVHALRNLNGK